MADETKENAPADGGHRPPRAEHGRSGGSGSRCGSSLV